MRLFVSNSCAYAMRLELIELPSFQNCDWVSFLPLSCMPPDSGGHFDACLVGFRRFRAGCAFNLDTVALPDATQLCVHQAGNTVFARQNAEVRANGAASANDAFELLKDRRGQSAAAVVNDSYGF